MGTRVYSHLHVCTHFHSHFHMYFFLTHTHTQTHSYTCTPLLSQTHLCLHPRSQLATLTLSLYRNLQTHLHMHTRFHRNIQTHLHIDRYIYLIYTIALLSISLTSLFAVITFHFLSSSSFFHFTFYCCHLILIHFFHHISIFLFLIIWHSLVVSLFYIPGDLFCFMFPIHHFLPYPSFISHQFLHGVFACSLQKEVKDKEKFERRIYEVSLILYILQNLSIIQAVSTNPSWIFTGNHNVCS